MVQGGVFTVGGRKLLALGLPLPPLDEGSSKSWVQVIPGEGKFDGHADGPFEFTESVVDQVVRNFGKRSTPVKVDYEHDTHRTELTGPKPASGHVLSLEKRSGANGAELWAFVEWTERAAGFIRGKEYNFNSPVIAFAWDDPQSGEDQGATLLSLALTDTPFLDGQQPIQLTLFGSNSRGGISMAEDEKKPELTEDEPKEMTEDEEKPSELMEDEEHEMAEEDAPADGNALLDAVAEKSGLDRAAALAFLMEDLDHISARINSAADKDGTPAEMRMSEQRKEERALRLEVHAQKAQIKQLTEALSGVQKREQARKRREIEAQVDALMAEGKVPDDMRDDAIHMFSEDPERAARIFKNKIVPVGEFQAGESPAPPDPKTAKLDDLPDNVRSLAQSFIKAKVRGGNQQDCIALAIEKVEN